MKASREVHGVPVQQIITKGINGDDSVLDRLYDPDPIYVKNGT